MSSAPPGPARTQEDLRGLVFYSLLAGATALIPIPLLDDWAFAVVRRRMARDILRSREVQAGRLQLRIVLGLYDPGRAGGCLYKAVFTLVVVPLRILSRFLRDLFRKILIFLAVKQASDWASNAFHEGYLLRCAAGKLPAGSRLGKTEARRIRFAIRLTLRGLNTSPVWNIFHGIIRLNRRLLRKAAAGLARLGRSDRHGKAEGMDEPAVDEYLRQERRLLDEVVSRLADLLAGERGYLEQIERRFEGFYGVGGSAAAAPAAPPDESGSPGRRPPD
ncbi:MAG: hypothetical protein WAO20_06780 [Acidobacteriota bacterium]